MRQFAFNITLAISLAACSVPDAAQAQTLEGFASLPARTFEPGPTSGQFITPANGQTAPFVNTQPVQGISSVLRTSNGEFWVMSDNGFGTKETSPDYVLRVHRISPDFRTAAGKAVKGTGSISVTGFITLRDPDKMIDFPIVADMTTYPGSTPAIPVAAAIRTERLLTGWDFDIESMREANDGTLWFGDEFGPFLVHTDASGRLLEAPIELPGVRAPQNPFLGNAAFNLPRSKGFEGMAISPDSKTLFPMLEGALTTDTDQRWLRIYEFDVDGRSYTGRQWWYHLESPANSIGDLTAVSKNTFLVIERDNFEGTAAIFKKIYLLHLDQVGADGFLVKQPVVDLMNVADPNHLGSAAGVFRFPFQTIESVIPLSRTEIGVLNDNNYPFSNGRTPGQPDPNEFIVIRLPEPLK